MQIHLVIGGARSGKTGYAERTTLAQAQRRGETAVYVATGIAMDEEMQARIDRHQALRPDKYRLFECPRDLPQSIERLAREGAGVLLVDCMATYLGTAMYDRGELCSAEPLLTIGVQLAEALHQYPFPVCVVSNEVGSGVVPSFSSGRLFRDVLGQWNSLMAEYATDVTLIVAGLPLPLKRKGRPLAPLDDDLWEE